MCPATSGYANTLLACLGIVLVLSVFNLIVMVIAWSRKRRHWTKLTLDSNMEDEGGYMEPLAAPKREASPEHIYDEASPKHLYDVVLKVGKENVLADHIYEKVN